MAEPARSLLISLGCADWASLNQHIDSGRMPHLEALMAGGCVAPVASAWPVELEAALATVVTGCLADRHGVLGPVQVRADVGGIETTGRRSWREPALWDVASAAGLAAVTVNWPGTSGASGFPGIHVDPRFALASGTGFDTWAVPPGSVAPLDLADELAGLRVHPMDALDEELRLFAPQWRSAAPQAVAALRASLAKVLTIHAVASELAEKRTWHLFCVHYEWLQEIALAFAPVAEGPLAAVHDHAHALQDAMLGRLIEFTDPGTTVTVISPIGLGNAGGTAPRVQPRGALVMSGPGIEGDRLLPGVRAQDVAPTLLARLGLTTPSDGTPLPDLAPAAARRAVRSQLAGPSCEIDPALALLADGYRDRLSPPQIVAMARAERHRAVNHALASLWRGDGRAAIERLETVLARAPEDRVAWLALGRARLMVGDHAGLRPVGEALLAARPADPWGHLAMAAWHTLVGDPADAAVPLEKAFTLGDGDIELFLRLAGLELLRGEAARSAVSCEHVLSLDPQVADAWFGLGMARERLGAREDAEVAYRRALRLQSHLPLAQLQLGELLLAQGRLVEAAQRLKTAVEQDPSLVQARRLLRRAQQAMFKLA